MCGIVGFIGEQEAAPILLECIARMEAEDMTRRVWRCWIR